MSCAQARIEELHAKRPRSRLLRFSLGLMVLLTAWSWGSGEFSIGDFLSARRLENLKRFLAEVRPPGEILPWLSQLWSGGGDDALARTLAMSLIAISLAGALALLSVFPASATFSRGRAYERQTLDGPAGARLAWRALLLGTRGLLIFHRAIPEYVWAFLLISLVGVSPWAAVVALAMHAWGILGRLGAETIENLPEAAQVQLRACGASRWSTSLVAVAPQVLPRWLAFFAYRWEACLREATVLGMLGIASLGSLIQDARVRARPDELLAYVLAAAALVLVVDLATAVLVRDRPGATVPRGT